MFTYNLFSDVRVSDMFALVQIQAIRPIIKTSNFLIMQISDTEFKTDENIDR